MLESGQDAFSIYPPDEARARIRAAESAPHCAMITHPDLVTDLLLGPTEAS